MSTKVVFNACYGGFGFSAKAEEALRAVGVDPGNCSRHDPRVVAVVEELGAAANGDCAELAIHVVAGRKYWIEEYDGHETVYEPSTIPWVKVR